MKIVFHNRKLEKECCRQQQLQKIYGDRQAKLINIRLAALHAAVTLGDFWPPYGPGDRCHELKGNRSGQLSMDLVHPYRLIFCPAHDPIPQRPEGGLDWHKITAITIIGVENTHD